MKADIRYRQKINGFILSYSQIFFSNNKILGAILILVSFFDFWSGFTGAFAVLTSLLIATQLGFDKVSAEKGVYTYNSLLTGLGIGLYFEPSIQLLIYTFFVSLVVLLLSVGIARFMSYYGLPFLSIPFLLGIWLVDLSGHSFTSLGFSDRGIFELNHIYDLGGPRLMNFYDWISSIPIIYSLKVYFLSLGAIFFQYQVIAGIIIAIGLLIHSRITFLLSLIGFYAAWFFYYILGASLYNLSYSYIGFNFILTAIALGGFYLIPNKFSFGWMLLILPTVVLITIASADLFGQLRLGIYALPFNVVVILFIWVNKLRIKKKYELKEVLIQHYSPEQNLYFASQAERRFVELKYMPIGLPVSGEWSISQAHNGEYTHQDKWKHAWDFVITQKDGKQYKGEGNYVADYLCYEKNVVAAQDGFVQEIVDGITDNIIGEINIRNNWGNTIIIKHSEYLYSKYSHLKKDSILVKKGDWVRKGQLIAKVGNTGRSPYPHLHFQLQQTPYIGSETIEYPFASYLTKSDEGILKLHLYECPKQNDRLQKTIPNELMSKALKWEVGQEIEFQVKINGFEENLFWKVKTDIYKNTYIHCESSDSYAYFYHDGELSYFKNFIGDKKSAIYHFFLAFNKIHSSFNGGIILEDEIALHLSNQNKWKMFLQDFAAPFTIYLKTKFKIQYLDMDDELSPSLLRLKSEVAHLKYNKVMSQDVYDIKIHTGGYIEFSNTKMNFHAIQKQ